MILLQEDDPQTGTVPPLRDGDRLTADEFHRRYDAMPEVKKAELLNGVVYIMSSPVRYVQHGRPVGQIVTWLGVYEAGTPGVLSGTDCTARINNRNEPQPDAVLFLDQAHGGQATLDARGYIAGSPEFVAEIGASTIDRDIGPKRDIYEQTGVREYLLWDVDGDRINWWHLTDGAYQLLPMDGNGIIRSRVFPGLWLDVPALRAGDGAGVLATLNRGMAERDISNEE